MMKTNKKTEEQCKKSRELWHLAEERMELLDTIKEMVKTEVSRQMENTCCPNPLKGFGQNSDTSPGSKNMHDKEQDRKKKKTAET